MKCGDIVRNCWASEDNPTRYFIYIRNNGKFTEVIRYDGTTLCRGKFYTSSFKEHPDKFVIVGHIDLIGFLKEPLKMLLVQDLMKKSPSNDAKD